jgi:hypothetical protein
MSDQQLVISIFKDEAAADAAVEEIKAWEAQWDEVRLNAIGVLVLDEHGKLKTPKADKPGHGKKDKKPKKEKAAKKAA